MAGARGRKRSGARGGLQNRCACTSTVDEATDEVGATVQHALAVANTDKALAIDADSVKALYRRGVAKSRLMRWPDAERDLAGCIRSANPQYAAVPKPTTGLGGPDQT